MNEKEIATYYEALARGEKGLFTAFLCLHLGGTPHSWQLKFLKWGKGATQKLSPVIKNELVSIIQNSSWKMI